MLRVSRVGVGKWRGYSFLLERMGGRRLGREVGVDSRFEKTRWQASLEKKASQQADSRIWPWPLSVQRQATQSVRRRA